MPPAPDRVQCVDREQRKMRSAISRLRMLPDEEPVVFCRRRNRQATALMNQHGRWSSKVCRHLYSWYRHLHRDSANNLWVPRILPLVKRNGFHSDTDSLAVALTPGSSARMSRSDGVQASGLPEHMCRSGLAENRPFHRCKLLGTTLLDCSRQCCGSVLLTACV